MGDQAPQSAFTQLPASMADNAASSEVSTASSKEDPLRGFYPEDLPESTKSTNGGFVSGGFSSGIGGSFSSSSSSGCTSGCCPH
jgi:hypothetical protein